MVIGLKIADINVMNTVSVCLVERNISVLANFDVPF